MMMMMSSRLNTNEVKDNFFDLYSRIKQFSSTHGQDFQDMILQAIKLSSKGCNNLEILKKLDNRNQSQYFAYRATHSSTPNPRTAVWVLAGLTGQGKSCLTNSICGQQVAQEGPRNRSVTSEAKLYQVKKSNLYVMDTPGFFDTRPEMNDEKVGDEIVRKVQKKLEVDAYIEAIFLMWDPARFMRLQLDAMLQKLCACFGPKVLDSVVFVVNKVTNKWDQECDYAVDELWEDLCCRGLKIPMIILDAKRLTKQDFEDLKGVCQLVQPYKEADFEKYRRNYYYQKFIQLKTAKDKKIRERKRIEDLTRQEEQRKAQEKERKLRQEYEERQQREAEDKEREFRRQIEERDRKLRQEYEENERRIRKEYEEMQQREAEERERKRQIEERDRKLRQEDEERQQREAQERERKRQIEERNRKFQQEAEQWLQFEIPQQYQQPQQQLQQSYSNYGTSLSPVWGFLNDLSGISLSKNSNYGTCRSTCSTYSAYSNINDSVSGRKTKSGGNDHRDLSYREVRSAKKNGQPDMRFKSNWN